MKTVLFIGTHGVFRAKYAEAYFNYKFAGTGYTAISRGTCPRQGRKPRFRPAWNENITLKHYAPYARKLQFNDLSDADLKFGMYGVENRPQLFYESLKKCSGTWLSSDAVDVEYWRVPNLVGTGDSVDGYEMDDPREIISLIEFNVDSLADQIL